MNQTYVTESASGCEIAVIGVSCRAPGAPDIETLWSILCDAREGLERKSADALRELGLSPETLNDPAFVPVSGRLQGAEDFDSAFFGMSPRECLLLDPQHRVLLECAYHALENAAYHPPTMGASVGVFAACGLQTYLLNILSRHVDLMTLDGLELLIANDKDFLASRVSYKLGLRGPAVTVQTGCSSSLTAVHMACQALIAGDCDAALAGGVSIHYGAPWGYRYSPNAMFSPDGHCRAYDQDGHGTAFGDGAGVVVLRRLEDAVACGDPVLAVIKGTAINNDGDQKVGYTAPSASGQAAVIRAAHRVAGVSPESVGFIEGHGTATELGDPIELSALMEVFRAHTDGRTRYLGSVKSNIGHLGPAAGIVSLIKAVLCVSRGVVPPTLHFRSFNRHVTGAEECFSVNTECRPWPEGFEKRRAGVSSFGVGGTNIHVCLEEAPCFQASSNRAEFYVLPISARTEGAARLRMEALKRRIVNEPELHALAAGLQIGTAHFECRGALICDGSGRILREYPVRAVSECVTKDLYSTESVSPEQLVEPWLQGREVDWRVSREQRRSAVEPYPFERVRYFAGDKGSPTKTLGDAGREARPVRAVELVWRQGEAAILGDISASKYLVLSEGTELGEDMVGRLSLRGASARNVDLSGPSYELAVKVDTAVKELGQVNVVIDLGGLGMELGGGDCVSAPARVAATVRVVERTLGDRPITYICCGRGAFSLSEGGIAYEAAGILGPLRVVSQEYPSFTCRYVDFPNDASRKSHSLLDMLCHEHSLSASLGRVAYRSGTRWEQVAMERHLERKQGFVPGGAYLITGGLGRLGRSLSAHLSERFGARVFVLARRPSAEEQRNVSSGGVVEVISGDVANPETLLGVLADFSRRGVRLDGIFHLAGHSSSKYLRSIRSTTVDDIALQHIPKVGGARAIQEAIAHYPVPFVALFSSLSSLIGGVTLYSYSAANSCLSAFAEQMNGTSNTRWLAIEWDAWLERDGQAMAKSLSADAIDLETGFEVLESIVADPSSQTIRVTRRSLYELEPTQAAPSAPEGELGGDATMPLLDQILLEMSKILGIPGMHDDDNFFDAGGDSLLALQLSASLSRMLNERVLPALVFDAPTARELAMLLSGRRASLESEECS